VDGIVFRKGDKGEVPTGDAKIAIHAGEEFLYRGQGDEERERQAVLPGRSLMIARYLARELIVEVNALTHGFLLCEVFAGHFFGKDD